MKAILEHRDGSERAIDWNGKGRIIRIPAIIKKLSPMKAGFVDFPQREMEEYEIYHKDSERGLFKQTV